MLNANALFYWTGRWCFWHFSEAGYAVLPVPACCLLSISLVNLTCDGHPPTFSDVIPCYLVFPVSASAETQNQSPIVFRGLIFTDWIVMPLLSQLKRCWLGQKRKAIAVRIVVLPLTKSGSGLLIAKRICSRNGNYSLTIRPHGLGANGLAEATSPP